MATVNEIIITGNFIKIDKYRWIRISSICTVTVSNNAPRFYVMLGVCSAEFFDTVYIGHDTIESADFYANRLIESMNVTRSDR